MTRHELTMPKRTRYKWYKLEKFYRGGSSLYQIRVPDIDLTREEWDEISEYIGERTDGGHSDGYRIVRHALPRKDRKIKVLQYPNHLCSRLMRFGKKVTTVSTETLI